MHPRAHKFSDITTQNYLDIKIHAYINYSDCKMLKIIFPDFLCLSVTSIQLIEETLKMFSCWREYQCGAIRIQTSMLITIA